MRTKKLITFKGKQSIKDKYIKRLEAHYKADEFIKGKYWENGKGCAVGCTIHGSDHSKYESELGIPRSIARLEDRIFEGLDNGEAKEFPLKFLNAVNVGADLSQVTNKFLLWLIKEVIKYTIKGSDPYKAIKRVIELYERVLNGEGVSQTEWLEAKNAAYAAYATYATYATYAAYAAATYAAAAYAAAVDADAYTAAVDAYTAATYAAAKRKSYGKQAKYLIKLLKEAK